MKVKFYKGGFIMKRKMIALFTVMGLTVSLLAGCGSSGTSETTNQTTTKGAGEANASELTTEDITLTVWESTGGPDDFIKQAGEKFTEKYPNITINYVNVELADSSTQIALDGPAGAGADLFAAPHDKLGQLVEDGHVLPTVNADVIKENILGACKTALTKEGTMYGYPVSAETYTLFYNKDLISEEDVPKTWEDLKAWSVKFNSENSGKYGFMMAVGSSYYTVLFTTSADNRLFGPEGTDVDNTNIVSEQSIKGMETYASLREILDFPAADITTAYGDGAFAAGNVAMYITGLWNVKTFEDAGIKFGVTTLPSLPGDTTPSASFSGTRAMFVSAYSDYPAEAAAFGEFLVSEEMQKLRFDITTTVPSIEIPVDSEYVEGFMKQLDYAFPMPSISQMDNWWGAMDAASANIWDGSDVKTELEAVETAVLQ